MFGSKKLKMENEALKQELASLKDKYQTDVETLERQLKEAKQLLNTAQQRYESSDELMSSSLKGGDAPNHSHSDGRKRSIYGA